MKEEILFTSRTHPKCLFRAIVIQIILIAVHILLVKFWPDNTGWADFDKYGALLAHGIVIVLEIWYVLVPVLQWRNAIFTLTNKRVKNDWGILYKQSREISLTKIASISEERGILDRIFGCGTLNFYDAAAAAQPKTGGVWNRSLVDSGVQFRDIPKVKHVRELIEKAKYSAQS